MSTPQIEITAKGGAPRVNEILTPEALAFLAELHRRFDGRRLELLARRARAAEAFDAGETPDFLAETTAIRDGDWKVAADPRRPPRPPRRDHRTGRPQDDRQRAELRRQGVHGRFRGRLLAGLRQHDRGPGQPEGPLGRQDRLHRRARPASFTRSKSNPAVLMVRPRGWHLNERHVLVDGEEISGSLFDFGLYVFHNAKAQWPQGSTPAFYLPKMESHLEARLWNDVFAFAEETLGLARGHVQGDGADRDPARRLRDGRDPLRTARPHRRAQLRPLGLYLLLHQAAGRRTRRS